MACGAETLASAHESFLEGLSLARLARGDEAALAFEAALAGYDAVLASEALNRDALQNRAICLTRLASYGDALDANRRLADAYPDFALAHFNLAETCLPLDRFEESVAACNRALGLDPALGRALLTKGFALAALGRFDDARDAMKAALASDDPQVRERVRDWVEPDGRPTILDPLDLFTAKLHDRLLRCEWARVEEDRLLIERALLASAPEARRPRSIAYRLVNLAISRRAQRIAVSQVSRVVESDAAQLARLPAPPARAPDRLLHVAYVSGCYCDHPAARLLRGVLREHDRKRFRVHAYALTPSDGSEEHREIVAASDRFVDLSRLDWYRAAKRIRDDGIDILVDHDGYIEGNRAEIVAQRPAPLQVALMGFPATLASSFIDYLIADRTVLPPGEEEDYAEQVVRLPHQYFANDYLGLEMSRQATRSGCGLPEQGFVFCAFNRYEKYDPQRFATWMRILRAVPESVLWMLAGPGAESLRTVAAAAGVAPERLVFAQRLPHKQHLDRSQLADLYLDTRLFNAHTITCDLLWGEVPVLTAPGDTWASRVAASLLRAAGLEELVARDEDEYAELAIALARDAARLERIKRHLAEKKEKLPLFDTPRYVRNLERAFETMWERHAAGQPPAGFDVADGGA